MQLSEFEMAILFVLEGEKRLLTHTDLSISLRKLSIAPPQQELYDYIESLEEKGLVSVKLIPTQRHRGFAGLRIKGKGRDILNALKEQQGPMQEPVKNPIGFRRDKD